MWSSGGGKRERAEAEQRIREFGEGRGRQQRTCEMESVSVEVEEEGEKMSLTLVDTPDWEAPRGGRPSVADDLDMERQMGGIVREMERRFEETLKAVSGPRG